MQLTKLFGAALAALSLFAAPLQAIAGCNTVATGGSISTIGGDRVHIFNSSGTLSFTANPPASGQYLVVAGGGAGGPGFVNARGQGGGGGGGVLQGTRRFSFGSLAVTVGAGGLASWTPGGNSSLGSLVVATGGGAGGISDTVSTPQQGGSGGGAADSTGAWAGAASVGGGQGFAGGSTPGSGGMGAAGAGGGGAGGAGQNGPAAGVTFPGGNGGAGISSSITGSAVTYGAGGLGGCAVACGVKPAPPANTGQGAIGGNGNFLNNPTTDGAAGRVVVRYTIADGTCPGIYLGAF